MTWGSALFGGDSIDVQDQLRSVQQIHATEATFAAIQTALLSHGRNESAVVTALEFESCGVCSRSRLQVQHLLLSCQMDHAAWDNPEHGGDCSKVQDQCRIGATFSPHHI